MTPPEPDELQDDSEAPSTDEAQLDEAQLDQTQQDEVSSDETPAEEEEKKLSVEVKVDDTNACGRHVTVTVSEEDVERYFDDAFSELMPKANVPGFRPGRAPRKLVERRFRKDLADQVKSSLLVDCVTQVTEEADFSAISEPDFDFDAVELPEKGPLTFEFDIEVRPEFELPQWKGVELERPVHDFTDEDIDAHLATLLERDAEMVDYDGPAELGDHLTLNVEFSKDGEPVSTLSDASIRLRPKLSFPDGTLENFGELLAGAKAGDEKTATFTLAEDAPNEERAGKELDVKFTLAAVRRLDTPELDDAFLSELGGFDSEGDLRDAVKADLIRQLGYHQQQAVREQISDMLTESADWELPADLLKRQSRRELDRAVLELRSAGFGDEDIQRYQNVLQQNSAESTTQALKEHFIFERIAEEEDVDAEPGDYDRELAAIATQGRESVRSARARLEKSGQMDALRNQIIERKVLELISGHAKYKDVETPPEETDVEAVEHHAGGEEPGADIPEAKHADEAEGLKEPADHT